MTLKELYGFCVNLNYHTVFALRMPLNNVCIFRGTYVEIPPAFLEREVIIFRIEENSEVSVWLRRE